MSLINFNMLKLKNFKKSFNFVKLSAFTLAETLMVMAILGVVASLTIPNLKDNADDQVIVAQAKKLYAELETAYSRATMKYGNSNNWGSANFHARLAEFLDVTVRCSDSNHKACWAGVTCSDSANVKTYLLKSGQALCIVPGLQYFYIDVNGAKEPNTLGRDRLIVSHITDSLESHLAPYYTVPTANSTPDTMYYFDALGWILNYGNQDYLKCASNLKWFSDNTTCN